MHTNPKQEALRNCRPFAFISVHEWFSPFHSQLVFSFESTQRRFACLDHLFSGDKRKAFVFALNTFDQATAFAVDGSAQDAMAGTIWMPAARPVASGEDGDAPGANRSGQVHRAGVVAEIKQAVLESYRGRPE